MATVRWLTEPDVTYPDSDGRPMAENTTQFRWIQTIQGGLDALFADQPDILVVGDLLWYPVEGRPASRMAPDVMVIFGRPKGDRGSYRQWQEGGVPPHVAIEILSPGNRPRLMAWKLKFYERHGIQEYYIYDPDRLLLTGYLREDDSLRPIPQMDGYTSPRLGVRFELDPELRVIAPDGRVFVSYVELSRRGDALARENDRLTLREEVARQAAEEQRRQIEAQRQAAEEQRRQIEDARRTADAARERAERLAEKLRALGIDPDA